MSVLTPLSLIKFGSLLTSPIQKAMVIGQTASGLEMESPYRSTVNDMSPMVVFSRVKRRDPAAVVPVPMGFCLEQGRK